MKNNSNMIAKRKITLFKLSENQSKIGKKGLKIRYANILQLKFPSLAVQKISCQDSIMLNNKAKITLNFVGLINSINLLVILFKR